MSADVSGHVSTGSLPASDVVHDAVRGAYERHRDVVEGANSAVYPALARVPSDLFGISLVGVDGVVSEIGDAQRGFSIMSVSKPFVYALVCQAVGPEAARAMIGANATGRAFNSLAAIEADAEGRTNPMVNPGAIATTSLVPGAGSDERWSAIQQGLSRFAGRELTVDDEIYRSASATNHRNRAITMLLESLGRMSSDPIEALDLYTRQCSLDVTAHDLAVMGATLADGGVNPVTRERVVDADVCHYTLAAMVTAGMYEMSGDWLYQVGLPGKSGIGGGIVTVSPGKGGLGTFAPPLDGAGNSVKGRLVAQDLSVSLGMDLFVSKPHA